jgi:hypothetical protein
VGDRDYYYWDGGYYEPHWHSGSVYYQPVYAPTGAVVCDLPSYHTEIQNGVTYYVYDGVYYERVYDGDDVCYRVVWYE